MTKNEIDWQISDPRILTGFITCSNYVNGLVSGIKSTLPVVHCENSNWKKTIDLSSQRD